MWPLCRIFSISAGDLQTIAILDVIIDNAKNLRGHLVGRQIPIHCLQPPLRPVVFRHGLRLLFERMQTLSDDGLAVVRTNDQLGPIEVTTLIDLGWLKVDVVDPSTGGTRATSREPEQQLIIVDLQLDHNRQPVAAVRVVKELILQEGIQPACLRRGSRKTIQNKTTMTI